MLYKVQLNLYCKNSQEFLIVQQVETWLYLLLCGVLWSRLHQILSWIIHDILLHTDYILFAAKMQVLFIYAALSSKCNYDIYTQMSQDDI